MKILSKLSRRQLLIRGGSAFSGMVLLPAPHAIQNRGGQEETLVPFLDVPPRTDRAAERNLLEWQELDSWITPNDEFFRVSHYNKPTLRESDYKLDINGLVEDPKSFTLDDLKARPRREVTFTLECSGNHGFPWFEGAIGTARWTGTPLAPILREAGVMEKGIEVVFFGSDQGEEEIRGNKLQQNFARSMSLEDAMNPNNLLCYEMNGQPLPPAHGFPLRLIVPGWYGIANVKWLKRIQILDTRFMGRFMARDYVTLRQERVRGEPVWMETSVGRSLLKSVTAKVTREGGRYRIYGAAWGAPIDRVEVQIDGKDWMKASIDQGQDAEFAWKFWHFDWPNPSAGEHTILSRAIDRNGNVQPKLEDPRMRTKKTYWESNAQVVRRIRIR